MAEVQINQRGEIGRQHVKAHSCSHFSPCFDYTSPTQTNDGTSQIDLTAARLAQLGERRSAEREAVGSNPGRTNTRGL